MDFAHFSTLVARKTNFILSQVLNRGIVHTTIHNDDAESEIKDKSDQSHISEPAQRAQRRVHELLPPGDEQPSEPCDPGCLDQDIDQNCDYVNSVEHFKAILTLLSRISHRRSTTCRSRRHS